MALASAGRFSFGTSMAVREPRATGTKLALVASSMLPKAEYIDWSATRAAW
jgi:hypothetical protein